MRFRFTGYVTLWPMKAITSMLSIAWIRFICCIRVHRLSGLQNIRELSDMSCAAVMEAFRRC
jgi:hypothetical protein